VLRLPRPAPSSYFYLALAALATAPAWIVRYPPLQDMPFHVAAMRVIHSFGDPAFGIEKFFELTFSRTQYFLYYVIGSVVAYFTGVRAANVVLLCVYLGGTPLAVRSLCKAIGKDERLAIFTLPLLVNVMFTYGFLPFVFGIPLLFWALAAAVRFLDELQSARDPKKLRREGILLAVLAFVLFFSHIFPFALFGLGFAVLFPWQRPRDWVRAAMPTVPSLLALGWWYFFTQSGKIAQGQVAPRDMLQGPDLVPLPIDQKLHEVFQWSVDVFRDATDERWFAAFAFVAILALGLSQGDRSSARREARLLVALPLACVCGYLFLARGRGSVWLVAERFPVLFLFTLVPMLRFPRQGIRAWLTTAAAVAVGIGSITNVCHHFLEFQLEEVGDLDEAIQQIPPGMKVAGLIFDKGSSVANGAPFLHFGSYYQADRGGVIEFTYAGYVHWPFDFRPGMYPPQPGQPPDSPARKRWEWTPEQVSVSQELMPYYDYVLERGQGFRPPPGTFQQVWRGDRWSVWKHP
jgi:hypothetical protein